MVSPPSFSALRAFEAAARYLSFKDAAQELGLTQTAVSHQIRKLEAQLGLRLFERHHRSVSLTPSGQSLAEATSAAMGLIDRAIERLQDDERGLTISATPAFATLWLAPRLARFTQAHPDIMLRVESSFEPIDLHRNRRIDAAIRYTPTPPDEGAFLASENFFAFGAPAHLASLTTGGDTRLLVPRWVKASFPVLDTADWIAQLGLPAHTPVSVFDDEQHAIFAALGGQGLVLASDILVQNLTQAGFLQAFKATISIPGFHYYLLAPKDGHHRLKALRFRRWLMAAIATDDKT